MARRIEWSRMGRNGVLLRFPGKPGEETARYARALRKALSDDPAGEVRDYVFASGAAFVSRIPKYPAPFEEWARDLALRIARAADSLTREHRKRIPVRYDGRDLKRVAEESGLTVEEVVAIHLRTTYTVQAMGGTPGFAVLAGLDPRLRVPPNPKPRGALKAGAVAVADDVCVLIGVDQPGDWNVVGATVEPPFDPDRTPPFLVEPGDRIRLTRAAEPGRNPEEPNG